MVIELNFEEAKEVLLGIAMADVQGVANTAVVNEIAKNRKRISRD